MNSIRLRSGSAFRRLGLSAAVCAAVLAAGACGSEQQAPAGSAAAPSPADRSIPVVAGPDPASHPPVTTSATADSAHCGATKGPDGALQVRLVAGDVTCETAMAIAKEYSPLIATGQAQTVSGWDCHPSTVGGELSRCTRNDQIFALTAV